MIRHRLAINLDWVLGLRVPDELSGDHPTLVHQLVETVLSICPGLTKDDGASFDSWAQADAVTGDTLAIAFHIKLLNVCGELQKSLRVRKDGS